MDKLKREQKKRKIKHNVMPWLFALVSILMIVVIVWLVYYYFFTPNYGY